MSKVLSETYLFGKYPDYEKNLFEAIVKGDTIDKDVSGFNDILTDVKRRQVSESLITVLRSPNVVLLNLDRSLPPALKVFAAKDVKDNKKLKVFIDCSGLIYKNDKGVYICDNVDILISHIVNARTTLIYYADEARIVRNNSVISKGTEIFAKLFTSVIDRIYKINSIPGLKDKCLYLSSLYYLFNILGKDSSEEMLRIAKNVSSIGGREADLLDYKIDKDTFINIKFFIEKLSDILVLDKLSTELFLEKWIWHYGTSTVFALELFPAFSAMVTNCYVGAYVNNQKTIEKIAGTEMVVYSKQIIELGEGSV